MLSSRRFLVTVGMVTAVSVYAQGEPAGAAAGTTPLTEDHGYGPVEPVLVPNVKVITHEGRAVPLPDLLAGRRTAIQFVFVDCQTACPLLGNLFHNVEQRLGGKTGGQTGGQTGLLSITVNPERDSPARLREFLRRHQAGARWTAVRAERRDLARILAVFGQQDGPPSGHTMKVFFTDAQARYVGRTVMLPQAIRVANALLGKAELAGGSLEAPSPASPAVRPDLPASGEKYYFGAAPLSARIGGESLSPAAARCANCHGADRRGVAEGKTQPSAVDAESLGALRPRRGGPPSAYTAVSLCESLRTGVDPAGVTFSSAMPRYELDAQQCAAIAEFLLKR